MSNVTPIKAYSLPMNFINYNDGSYSTASLRSIKSVLSLLSKIGNKL